MRAAIMGGGVFPRRLTQLFADTKRSYENVVQTQHTDSETSSLHLRLRIQKDRLIAWGMQWSDSSTVAQTDDIDGSLDRAGISDLVASIMSSIRELLDEAEDLTLPQSRELPQIYGDVKLLGKSIETSWNTNNSRRLEEILKDLTTSIDTLCDLSRPRLEDWSQADSLANKDGAVNSGSSNSSSAAKSSVATSTFFHEDCRKSATMRSDDVVRSARIEERRLRLSKATPTPTSSPPSYEFVATSAEDRALAYLSSSPAYRSNSNSLDTDGETAVLLDYGPYTEATHLKDILPDELRFQEISRFQESLHPQQGFLRLRGWTLDSERSRCAYVYELPDPQETSATLHDDLQPRSLLSFLQNGRDADSNNMPSLENRFRLALNIAASIMLLHGKGVTHRNVNSNNIIFFVDSNSLSSEEKVWKGRIIRSPYLTAFHQIGLQTAAVGADPTFSSIYQHPNLDGSDKDAYEYSHDQYSLGLILLEIGLWMPIGKFWKSKYTRHDFKSRLQSIYLKKLSGKCGDGYMNVVLECMTAADRATLAERDIPPHALQQNCGESGFYQAVVAQLERCCSIEESPRKGVSQYPRAARQSLISEKETRLLNPPTVDPTSVTVVDKFSSCLETPRDDQIGDLIRPKHSILPTRKIKVWSHELPSLYSKYWGSTMFPKLERILSRAISRWESYTIDLFMAGEDSDTARPTVFMECTSTGKVRKILRHLNKELRLFEIKVVSGQIIRSKAGKKKRKVAQMKHQNIISSTTQDAAQERDHSLLNPYYQEKPVCGASIGAFRNGNHLPPVSFGGAVMINGEPFGMSVHHMLEDEDEVESGLDDVTGMLRSIAPRPISLNSNATIAKQSCYVEGHQQGLYPFEVSELAEAADDSSEGYTFSEGSSSPYLCSGFPPEAVYPYEISEDKSDVHLDVVEDDEFWLSPDFDTDTTLSYRADDEEDGAELGDTLGVQVGCGRDVVVTQPAIDDVEQGYFPSEEDKDEEHLSSHTLGHIHASSGIKRSRRDELIHEVDWALIKINEQRVQIHNMVQGGGQFCTSTSYSDSHPCRVVKATDLGGLQVHASGRTSGLQTGLILPAMRMVRMPGRSFASHSWQVRGNFGEGGDSGAWVLDNTTGHVCGHVLAYSSASSIAYIAPMEVLLDDMAATLGATVTLPDHTVSNQQRTPSIPSEQPFQRLAQGTSGFLATESHRGGSRKKVLSRPHGFPSQSNSSSALVNELDKLSITKPSSGSPERGGKQHKAGDDHVPSADAKRLAGDSPSKRLSGGSLSSHMAGGSVMGRSQDRGGMARGSRLILT
ncbi:hypothetical protein MMC13_001684 [Lambiella insularis]|nr:hypothetical protein [Lambiella insularis]